MEENKNLALTTYMEDGSEDKDYRAEKIVFWAAGRSGLFALSPKFSVPALVANNTYMITSLARLHNVDLKKGAISGLIAGLGVACAGALVSLALPIKVMRVPVAVGLTYALGKVANIWIKDGMPSDVSAYIPMVQQWMDEGKAMCSQIINDVKASIPDGAADYISAIGALAGGGVKGAVDELATPEFKQAVKETAEAACYKAHDTAANTIAGITSAVKNGPKTALDGTFVSETTKNILNSDLANVVSGVAEVARYKVHDTAAEAVAKVTDTFKK